MGGRPHRRPRQLLSHRHLVDRTILYIKLQHLLNGRGAENVRDALLHAFVELPAELDRSLTWDQGSEMGRHDEFTRATDVPIYFCEPTSPWQRGSNEERQRPHPAVLPDLYWGSGVRDRVGRP
ncbi:transposase [Streptomyces sp. NPDC054794]